MEEDAPLVQLPRRPPSSHTASSIFPNFDEKCDNYGFSWVTLEKNEDVDLVEDDKEGEDGGSSTRKSQSYKERLQADSVFHNPAALELMLSAYAIPPHCSFTTHMISLKNSNDSNITNGKGNSIGEEEEWDYLTLRNSRHFHMSEEYTERAITLTRQGKYEKSLNLLKNALSYKPDNVTALVTCGANYANLGKYEEAIEKFEIALLNDPECENAKKYLESTKQKMNQVRNIADIAVSATSAQRVTEGADNYDNRSQSGIGNTLVSKKHSALSKYSTGDENWSYVPEDNSDDYENTDELKLSKRKKEKKSHKKKNKKSDKKRKHKSDKKSKKSKRTRKHSPDSRSTSSSDDSNDHKSNRDTAESFSAKSEEAIHPILSRSKNKLWD